MTPQHRPLAQLAPAASLHYTAFVSKSELAFDLRISRRTLSRYVHHHRLYERMGLACFEDFNAMRLLSPEHANTLVRAFTGAPQGTENGNAARRGANGGAAS